MDDLIKAITSNDLVKFKQSFNEAMHEKVKQKLDEEQLRIAQSVVIEGEEPVKGEDDDDDDDDDGEDE